MNVEIKERPENEKQAYWQGYATALHLAEANPASIATLREIIPPEYRKDDPNA